MTQTFSPDPASYRDPSGFVFWKDGIVYRQVNQSFKEHFDHFINSGCYAEMVKCGWLLPHQPLSENLTGSPDWYLTLKPEPIDQLSYPYEWSFDMLKYAALLTLGLQRKAITHGMMLKDAAPYNIQWQKGQLIFIDTLSFEKYNENEPWIAYRQFCEQFLSPLLLMHYRKMPLHQMMLAYPEGIPLAITSALLPRRSKFSLHTYLHIHLNARVSAKANAEKNKSARFSKQKMLNLISSLEILVKKLRLPRQSSVWSDYYDEASQREDYLTNKRSIISDWLSTMNNINGAIDLGANDGAFSKLLAEQGIKTIAADFDPYCINDLYISLRGRKETNIQPMIIDLVLPSPAIGVNNEERPSFIKRSSADLVLALALVHHLAIGKNIPFDKIAALFQQLNRKWLIIEFIPKTDEKIKLMLTVKKDIYTDYTKDNFEKAFEQYYKVEKKQDIGGSGRTLYLMSKRDALPH